MDYRVEIQIVLYREFLAIFGKHAMYTECLDRCGKLIHFLEYFHAQPLVPEHLLPDFITFW